MRPKFWKFADWQDYPFNRWRCIAAAKSSVLGAIGGYERACAERQGEARGLRWFESSPRSSLEQGQHMPRPKLNPVLIGQRPAG